MPKQHGAREQKKTAKQKAKRDARKRQLAQRSSPDPNVRLKMCERWPITATLVPEKLWTIGIGQLIFARRMPDGQIGYAVFLVDVFCLGVKNAFWQIASPHDFEKMVKAIEEIGRLKNASPEYFSKLVHCAADYAQSLGFAPHRDFRHARLLLAGVDPSLCEEEFEFGQDGRPFYVRGPNETLDQAHSIATRVHAQGGHYVIPLPDDEVSPNLELIALDEDDEYENEYDDDQDEDDGGPHIIDV